MLRARRVRRNGTSRMTMTAMTACFCIRPDDNKVVEIAKVRGHTLGGFESRVDTVTATPHRAPQCSSTWAALYSPKAKVAPSGTTPTYWLPFDRTKNKCARSSPYEHRHYRSSAMDGKFMLVASMRKMIPVPVDDWHRYVFDWTGVVVPLEISIGQKEEKVESGLFEAVKNTMTGFHVCVYEKISEGGWRAVGEDFFNKTSPATFLDKLSEGQEISVQNWINSEASDMKVTSTDTAATGEADKAKREFKLVQEHDAQMMGRIEDVGEFVKTAEMVNDELSLQASTALSYELKEIMENMTLKVKIPSSSDRLPSLVLSKTTEEELKEELESLFMDKRVGDQIRIITEGLDRSTFVRHHKPVHALFYGKPGCGKTAYVNHLSNKFVVPVVEITGETSVSVMEGRTQTALAQKLQMVELFDSMICAGPDYGPGTIFFLDEADAVLQPRKTQKSNPQSQKIGEEIVIEFLKWLEGAEQKRFSTKPLFVCATNFPSDIDSAVRDRLSATIGFDIPDDKQRYDQFRGMANTYKILNDAGVLTRLTKESNGLSNRDIATVQQQISSLLINRVTHKIKQGIDDREIMRDLSPNVEDFLKEIYKRRKI